MQISRNIHQPQLLLKLLGGVLLATSTLLVWFVVQPVNAQTSFALTVSPPSAYIRIKPGTKAVHQIQLTNNSATALTVLPRVFDSQPIEGTSYPQLQSTFTFPYLENQNQELTSLTLNPGETIRYDLNFSVPPDASFKEYPLTVLFSKVIEQNSVGGRNAAQSKLYGAVGSNIVVLISDAETLINGLTVLEVDQPVFQDSLRYLSFTPELFNQSIQSVIASGSATITNMFGKQVYTAAFYPDVVLGGQRLSARALIPATSSTPPQAVKFKYNPLFLLGKYTITASATDEQGQLLNTVSVTLFALPYSIVIAILVAIGGWMGIRILRRSLKNPEKN